MTVSGRAASALAFSPLTQILARRLPVRGGSRLVHEGYRRTAAASRPKPTTTVSVFGDSFQVDFDSWLEWQVWAFGTYEKQLGEFLGTILRPGDTALDAGANFGGTPSEWQSSWGSPDWSLPWRRHRPLPSG